MKIKWSVIEYGKRRVEIFLDDIIPKARNWVAEYMYDGSWESSLTYDFDDWNDPSRNEAYSKAGVHATNWVAPQ